MPVSGLDRLPVLETARLVLRPYTVEDIDALHRLWTDTGVRKYLWDDKIIERQVAADVVAGSIADVAERGYGQWAVSERPNREVVGFCGFRPSEESDHAPELLYGLLPRYWGKGLATEAAIAALRFAFEALRVPRVIAATDPPNLASIRVMKRLGMRFLRRGELNGLPTVFYEMQGDELRRP